MICGFFVEDCRFVNFVPWKRLASEYVTGYIVNGHHTSTQMTHKRSVVQRDLVRSSILISIKHKVLAEDELDMSVFFYGLAEGTL